MSVIDRSLRYMNTRVRRYASWDGTLICWSQLDVCILLSITISSMLKTRLTKIKGANAASPYCYIIVPQLISEIWQKLHNKCVRGDAISAICVILFLFYV